MGMGAGPQKPNSHVVVEGLESQTVWGCMPKGGPLEGLPSKVDLYVQKITGVTRARLCSDYKQGLAFLTFPSKQGKSHGLSNRGKTKR